MRERVTQTEKMKITTERDSVCEREREPVVFSCVLVPVTIMVFIQSGCIACFFVLLRN